MPVSSRICVSHGSGPLPRLQASLVETAFAEIRFDQLDFAEPSWEAADFSEIAFSLLRLPLRAVATFRGSNADADLRLDALEEAVCRGAAFVDLDLSASEHAIQRLAKAAHQRGAQLILSHHDFSATPPVDSLKFLCESAFARGADYFKIACVLHSPDDQRRLLSLLAARDFQAHIIPVGMSDSFALAARRDALLSGAPWTYAAPDGLLPAVASQPSLSELLSALPPNFPTF